MSNLPSENQTQEVSRLEPECLLQLIDSIVDGSELANPVECLYFENNRQPVSLPLSLARAAEYVPRLHEDEELSGISVSSGNQSPASQATYGTTRSGGSPRRQFEFRRVTSPPSMVEGLIFQYSVTQEESTAQQPAQQPAQQRSLRNRLTVKQIVERLYKWRLIGKERRLNLREAASQLRDQVSVKTLDDQLQNVMQGIYSGYDFLAHQSKKISHLREHNRAKRFRLSTIRQSATIKQNPLTNQEIEELYARLFGADVHVFRV